MQVLSLFDGISCGQLALHRAGVHVKKYSSSEIAGDAITITQNNFPNTEQLGDVRSVNETGFDLVIGGSPCQGISNAGNKKGLKDDRSKLFYEFKRIIDLNPKAYFLLENVRGQKESTDEISRIMGVTPVLINSNLMSAQVRKRFYWTNIPFDKNMRDLGITLKDIVEEPIEETIDKLYSEHCPDVNINGEKFDKELFFRTNKKHSSRSEIIRSMRGGDGKSRCMSAVSTNSAAGNGSTVVIPKGRPDKWRITSLLEQERLQTLPDHYTDISGISKNKRSYHIGNSWTVDVIAHILKGLPKTN